MVSTRPSLEGDSSQLAPLWPRFVECVAACVALAILSIPVELVALAVRLTSRVLSCTGPLVYDIFRGTREILQVWRAHGRSAPWFLMPLRFLKRLKQFLPHRASSRP